jgi:hypothetical protein
MKYLLPLIALLIFSSCKFDLSKDDAKDQEKMEKSSSEDRDSDERIEDLTKVLEDITEGEAVEPAPYQVLQEMLPKRLKGFDRVDMEGSKAGMLGIKISNASATYEDGDQEVEIHILDGGSLGAILSMADEWADVEFDRSDRNGFERTSTLSGFRCYEKFEKKGNSELAVIIDDRFLVTADGRVDDFDDLRDMVESLKLKRLQRRK